VLLRTARAKVNKGVRARGGSRGCRVPIEPALRGSRRYEESLEAFSVGNASNCAGAVERYFGLQGYLVLANICRRRIDEARRRSELPKTRESCQSCTPPPEAGFIRAPAKGRASGPAIPGLLMREGLDGEKMLCRRGTWKSPRSR